MEMKKLFSRSISVLVAMSLCLTVGGTAFASDTPSDWAAGSVNSAISYGLIPESVQGRYQDNITREEFAELLDEVCNDYSGGKGSFIFWDNYNKINYDDSEPPFTDTKNSAVRRMYLAGIMSGIGDGKFGANDPLTREQAAVMMSNLCDFASKPLPAAIANFSDNNEISSWALDSVGKIQAAGIMSGVGANKFAPKQNYTREQSIVTALKLYSYLRGVNSSSGGNSGSGSSGNNGGSSSVVPSGDFATVFQQLYDGLKYNVDRIEIANATERDLPSSDDFPEISSSLRSQYPGQEMAIGYLEAARSEMINACVCGIDIYFYKQMGYTSSTLYRRTQEKRAEIEEHVDKAYEYLEKAKSSVK